MKYQFEIEARHVQTTWDRVTGVFITSVPVGVLDDAAIDLEVSEFRRFGKVVRGSKKI